MQYTFAGMAGDNTTVEAPSEEEARHLAMEARWGYRYDITVPSSGREGRYAGRGLFLVQAQ